MATHSRILAWEIPWAEEPGELRSRGLQRVRHNWMTAPTHSLAHPLPKRKSRVTMCIPPWEDWLKATSLESFCPTTSDLSRRGWKCTATWAEKEWQMASWRGSAPQGRETLRTSPRRERRHMWGKGSPLNVCYFQRTPDPITSCQPQKTYPGSTLFPAWRSHRQPSEWEERSSHQGRKIKTPALCPFRSPSCYRRQPEASRSWCGRRVHWEKLLTLNHLLSL